MTSDTSSPRTETGLGGSSELGARVADRVPDLVVAHEPTARALRRDLHAHPELARAEHHATARLAELLTAAGAEVKLLPGTGLIADLGPDAPRERTIAVRADLDALRTPESTGLPYASTVPGVAHACGHDVHTASVLGAGLVLADLARTGDLPHRVRLLFQPAEEVMPGGALDVVGAGAVDDVAAIYGLHCDPSLDVGTVGSRPGRSRRRRTTSPSGCGGPGATPPARTWPVTSSSRSVRSSPSCPRSWPAASTRARA